MKIHRVRREVN